jgi:hypothetical protein
LFGGGGGKRFSTSKAIDERWEVTSRMKLLVKLPVTTQARSENIFHSHAAKNGSWNLNQVSL